MAHDDFRQKIKPISKRDESELMVEFSPNVLSRLAQLAETVRGSDEFDSGIMKNLQGHLSGKPIPVNRAVSTIGHITMEAMNHVSSSNGFEKKRTYDAVVDLMEALSTNDPACVKLVKVVDKGR